jgi:hypothetical protein
MTKTRVLNPIVARTILVLLIVAAVEDITYADSTIIETVKNHTKSFVREIRSIEFEAVATWNAEYRQNGFLPADRKISFREQLKYFQSGNMSGAATSNTYKGLFAYENSSSDWVIIYNGERFQIFQLDEKTKEWKEWDNWAYWGTTTPSRTMSPITQVFYWLNKGIFRPHAWSIITSEENIDDIFKQARYIGNRTHNGVECVVLEFPRTLPARTESEFVYEVWFSLEKDYLPVKIVFSVDGWITIDVEVKKIHEAILDNGTRLFIPVEIVKVDTYPRSDFTSSVDTIIMDTRTLKINHEIDDALFMQAATIAERVLHTGQLEEKDVLSKSDTDPVKRRLPPVTYIAIIAGIVFVGLLVVYWLWKKQPLTP